MKLFTVSCPESGIHRQNNETVDLSFTSVEHILNIVKQQRANHGRAFVIKYVWRCSDGKTWCENSVKKIQTCVGKIWSYATISTSLPIIISFGRLNCAKRMDFWSVCTIFTCERIIIFNPSKKMPAERCGAEIPALSF